MKYDINLSVWGIQWWSPWGWAVVHAAVTSVRRRSWWPVLNLRHHQHHLSLSDPPNLRTTHLLRICSEVSVNSPGNPWRQSRRRNGKLWWEGFAEKESFNPGVEVWRGNGWWKWWVDETGGGIATERTDWCKSGEIRAGLTEGSRKLVRETRGSILEGTICYSYGRWWRMRMRVNVTVTWHGWWCSCTASSSVYSAVDKLSVKDDTTALIANWRRALIAHCTHHRPHCICEMGNSNNCRKMCSCFAVCLQYAELFRKFYQFCVCNMNA